MQEQIDRLRKDIPNKENIKTWILESKDLIAPAVPPLSYVPYTVAVIFNSLTFWISRKEQVEDLIKETVDRARVAIEEWVRDLINNQPRPSPDSHVPPPVQDIIRVIMYDLVPRPDFALKTAGPSYGKVQQP